MPEPLYTADQVAAMLQIMPKTVLLWVRQGKLGGIKLGSAQNSRVRIPQSAVDAFREGRHEDHSADAQG